MIQAKATFLDSCIILVLCNADREEWLEKIIANYSCVYVTPEILEELVSPKANSLLQNLISQNKITIFDPSSLTKDLYIIYEAIFDEVVSDFSEFQENREDKVTKDEGDMSILAAAKFLDVGIITSEDSDFNNMISNKQYKISNPEADEDSIIEVHGFLQIGNYLINTCNISKKEFRNFIRSQYSSQYWSQINSEM